MSKIGTIALTEWIKKNVKNYYMTNLYKEVFNIIN